ncbi:MAG: nuclear transport factor 2 family protein [Planctomycetota bacterium]
MSDAPAMPELSPEYVDAIQVGKRLVELCSQGQYEQAAAELYADNIVSVEVCGMAGHPARIEGIDAVKAKGQWWAENHEVHGGDVKGPFAHGGRVAVWMSIDVTPKTGPMTGHRHTMEEVCLYTVKDGKIVHEEFFYDMTAGG